MYTSTLLNGLEDDKDDIGRDTTGTDGKKLLNNICDSHFDSVRDRDWFKALIEELEAAKKLRRRGYVLSFLPKHNEQEPFREVILDHFLSEKILKNSIQKPNRLTEFRVL